jgi:hypothetical protein
MQGEELRKTIGAALYIECRSKTKLVIHECFFSMGYSLKQYYIQCWMLVDSGGVHG